MPCGESSIAERDGLLAGSDGAVTPETSPSDAVGDGEEPERAAGLAAMAERCTARGSALCMSSSQSDHPSTGADAMRTMDFHHCNLDD